MAKNDEIEAGAKAIAEDLRLPGAGTKKLARVVEDHLDWFDKTEARGLTWADMSRLLFAAGAKGKNGRPLPVGTLYSTVWRKREDAKRIGGGIALSSKSTTGIQGSTQESPPRKGRMAPAPTWPAVPNDPFRERSGLPLRAAGARPRCRLSQGQRIATAETGPVANRNIRCHIQAIQQPPEWTGPVVHSLRLQNTPLGFHLPASQRPSAASTSHAEQID
jgi:hypothetical protein